MDGDPLPEGLRFLATIAPPIPTVHEPVPLGVHHHHFDAMLGPGCSADGSGTPACDLTLGDWERRWQNGVGGYGGTEETDIRQARALIDEVRRCHVALRAVEVVAEHYRSVALEHREKASRYVSPSEPRSFHLRHAAEAEEIAARILGEA